MQDHPILCVFLSVFWVLTCILGCIFGFEGSCMLCRDCMILIQDKHGASLGGGGMLLWVCLVEFSREVSVQVRGQVETLDGVQFPELRFSGICSEVPDPTLESRWKIHCAYRLTRTITIIFP